MTRRTRTDPAPDFRIDRLLDRHFPVKLVAFGGFVAGLFLGARASGADDSGEAFGYAILPALFLGGLLALATRKHNRIRARRITNTKGDRP